MQRISRRSLLCKDVCISVNSVDEIMGMLPFCVKGFWPQLYIDRLAALIRRTQFARIVGVISTFVKCPKPQK
jgi:hypothetical protein